MIQSLKIENFIIVDQLEVEFADGLQVLSGETGAGKSIIVGAIDLILGGSIRPGMLRNENKPAILEAVFDIDIRNKLLLELLKKYDVDETEGEVFLRREIGVNYRSKSFLNGRRIANSIVLEFRNALLDFHSQRDQQKLFDRDYQLEVLDIYGNLKVERTKFENNFLSLENQIKELQKLIRQEKEHSEKIKLYKYQVLEIEAINPQLNEDSTLQAELNLLSNAEAILNLASEMEQLVYEKDNSVYDTLSSFMGQLSIFEQDNEIISQSVNNLREALTNLDESIGGMREIQNVIDLDGSRLDEVQDRLNSINSMCNKYKRSLDKTLEYKNEMQNEIEDFSSNSEKINSIKNEIDLKIEKVIKSAEQLSNRRQKAARTFAKEIEVNIKQLAIPDAAINIQFEKLINSNGYSAKLNGINSRGLDSIDFYFSANKGVKLQPFRVAASGGELSRFLLSIKKILSDRLDNRTIIFDEIDAGIGGKTSELLAEFIHKIGNYHQVICISHLPQIAAYADTHYAIIKKSKEKSSEVDVNILTDNERKIEIARMLSGSQSELALQHAEELLIKSKERV
jgi:DNA repair protein RecN (Recombination protein N)